MQTATQSFATHAYTQIQGTSLFNNRRDKDVAAQQSSDPGTPAKHDDSVTLSATSMQLSQKDDKRTTPADQKGADQKPLSQEELKTLTELRSRDVEVRAHEQAHLSAAGGYATGGATFSYTTGPNGKRYASAGKVPIDTSTEDTPEATIQKMRTIRRAALAPANPSSADRAIAAQTSSKEIQAMKEMQEIDTEMSAKLSGPFASTETPGGSKNVNKPTSASEVSNYNRSAMASAYQAMATLAA
jgi:hypothetical protein